MRIRHGDTVEISGAYQYQARNAGPAVQRFWHHEKERMVRKFSSPQPGQRVLDVGCGSGVVADLLALMGAEVTGVDANAKAIEFARDLSSCKSGFSMRVCRGTCLRPGLH